MNRGSKHSATTLAKMSAVKTGKPSALRGRPRTEETKAKLSAALKGVPKSPEIRAKMSAALKGVPKSAEHRAAMKQGWAERRAGL